MKIDLQKIEISVRFEFYRINYRNEAGNDQPDVRPADDESDANNVFSFTAYSTHQVTFEGITFYTEEFRIENSDTAVSTKQKLFLKVGTVTFLNRN